MDIGISYLGRRDSNNIHTHIAGLDFTAKKRQGKVVKWLTQMEFIYRVFVNEQDALDRKYGLYLLNEYGWSWGSMGLHLGFVKENDRIDAVTQNKLNNIFYEASWHINYHSSEFLKIRGTILHHFEREEGFELYSDTSFAIQTIFILGSHPAHEF